MVNKGLCFTGCIVHFFLVTSLLMCVALFRKCDLPYNKWILILDAVFIICCIIIGRVFLKLDIDKLFLKFEIDGINALNKVFFYIVLTTALLVVGFEIIMVLIYLLKGVKMTSDEFLRFTVLPTLSLAHLAVGSGSYLALQYFMLS